MAKRARKPHDKHTTKKDAAGEAPVNESVNESAEGDEPKTGPGAETAADEERGAAAGETPVVPKEEYDALRDKYMRVMAEYDNYRKRSERDFTRLVETANERLMMEILPILDNLDRATEHRKNKTTLEEYAKGIAIIEDQLRQVLSSAGLESMNVVGEEFDPMIHDAVMQMPAEDCEPGVITAEVEKGYTLAGKVIRHPKVVVSK